MTTYRAIILGGIWMPYGAICSTERTYQAEDDANAIEKAYTSEAGDFSSVQDVFVLARENCQPQCHKDQIPHIRQRIVKDWDNEENELAYLDTISEEC